MSRWKRFSDWMRGRASVVLRDVLTLVALLLVATVFVRLGYDERMRLFAFARANIFAFLAPLPGLIGIVNHLVTEGPRYRKRERVLAALVQALDRSLTSDPDADSATEVFKRRFQVPGDTLHDERPRLSYTVFGALLLTFIFGLAAVQSHDREGLGLRPRFEPLGQPPLDQPATTTLPAAPAPPASLPAPPATTVPATTLPPPSTMAAAPPSTPADTTVRVSAEGGSNERIPLNEGVRGFVYAAYGAYVFAVGLIVGRLNTGTLTGRFLVRLAIQSSAGMLLGFAAGEFRIFRTVGSPHQSLAAYFLVGLFPGWARLALRRRAQQLFVREEVGCDSLPLCLVDGIDDDTADRLSELGIADIQHLATFDAGELILKTAYPQNRVLDWLDQAMLMTYVRHRITHFRNAGVRGAIDLCALYGDYMRLIAVDATGEAHQPAAKDPPDAPPTDGLTAKVPPPPTAPVHLPQDAPSVAATESPQQRARAVLTTLATKADLSLEVLLAIGRSLYEDSGVNLVWRLWQGVAEEEEEEHAGPRLMVAPPSGSPGTEFVCTASGYAANAPIRVFLRQPDSKEELLPVQTTNPSGGFKESIPSKDLAPGTYTVWAVEPDAGKVARATFEVKAEG